MTLRATSSSARRRRATAGASALGLAFVLGALGGCAAVSERVSVCGSESAPVGASTAARAYVDAINEATPAWQEISERLEDQGFVTHLTDLQAQVPVDTSFLRALRAIDFPAEAQPAARAFEVAVMKYDHVMRQSFDAGGFVPSFTVLDPRVNEQRAERSSELRATLRLAGSACILNRP